MDVQIGVDFCIWLSYYGKISRLEVELGKGV